ncbi:hypothetical protein GCM10022403_051140 [Streptomyces coacervatus]|uniref:Uncharacterized protein n=1 Tax=Streptomyces coacervatus TaxID=647381 RepID=A0ABP7I3Q4_9ACTN
MTGVPAARCQVLGEGCQARCEGGSPVWESREISGPNLGVQVGVGAAPVRGGEAVRAVVRDGDGLLVRPAEQAGQPVHRQGAGVVEGGGLWEVFAYEPELVAEDLLVPGQDHDAAAGGPAEFGDSGPRVGPVVDGLQRHDGVGGVVAHGKVFGDRADGGRRPGWVLRDHDLAGFDGENCLRGS